MINQEYLQYWQRTITDITLLGNLIKENIEMFEQTHDIQFIEYILESIKEIIRLIPLEKMYYDRIYSKELYPPSPKLVLELWKD